MTADITCTDRFLGFLQEEKRLLPATLDAYRLDFRQFETFCLDQLDVSPIDATLAQIVQFFLSLREYKGYSAATIARKMAAVKSFYHYLVRAGELAQNPAAQLESPEVIKAPPRIISVDEVTRLLHRAGNDTATGLRDRAMLQLLYATGVRVSELVALDLGDLDFKKQQIRCVGRGLRIRHLPVGEKALLALRAYLNTGRPELVQPNSPTEGLFLNWRGKRITRQGFWLIIRARAKASNVSGVTPHILRHSFAAHRLNDGTGLDKVRELLGHAHISTTLIYTQVQTA